MNPSHKKPKLGWLTQPVDFQKAAALPSWDKSSCQSRKCFGDFRTLWWWCKQRSLVFNSPKSTVFNLSWKSLSWKGTFPSVPLMGCAVLPITARQEEQRVTARGKQPHWWWHSHSQTLGTENPLPNPEHPELRGAAGAVQCERKGKQKLDVPLGLFRDQGDPPPFPTAESCSVFLADKPFWQC